MLERTQDQFMLILMLFETCQTPFQGLAVSHHLFKVSRHLKQVHVKFQGI